MMPIHEPQTLPRFLEEATSTSPEAPFLLTPEGIHLSYGEFRARVHQAANLMVRHGVVKGDKVALLLPNCPEYLYLWFGLAEIGAVHVAINTRLTGDPLRYQISQSDTSLAVVDESIIGRYREACIDLASVRDVLVRTDTGFVRELLAMDEQPPAPADIRPSDPLVIMYTSGTTGPPKGVVNCHNAYVRSGLDLARLMGLTADDRMYLFMPLFHGNPQMMGVMPIIAAGGSIALSPRFSASRFWDEVRSMEATVFTHIGSPLPILVAQPEAPDDADNPIRLILGGAPSEVSSAFGRRFDCVVLDGWGMIEAGCNTTITPADHIVAGSNGVPRECFEVRVVDSSDLEVATDEVGEIVVRPREPFVMFSGYYEDPARTLEAMGNLWFHTGDTGRIAGDGSLYFLGRASDAIRHKGENISSLEIEQVLNTHPAVGEAVVVGVPDPIAGQEMKACIVVADGNDLTSREIIDWCLSRLPEFMVPRYVVFKDDFERTGSHKVKRYVLRDEGTEEAWDRALDDTAR